MITSLIAAIGENRELGAKNQLLWHIPEDLKHFHDITVGHPIIMGRKTHESIGRILPGRTNIIITREVNYTVDGGVIVHSLEEAIDEANQEEKNNDSDKNEIFVIGGGQIFAQALPLAHRLYLTIVHASFPNADTFFPEYSQFTKVIQKEDHKSQGFSYSFLTVEK